MLRRLILVLRALEATHHATRAGDVVCVACDLVRTEDRVVFCAKARSANPECARSEKPTAAAAVADLVLGSSLALVLVVANARLRQGVENVRLVLVVLTVDPRLEAGAHLSLDQRVVVVKVGVMESWRKRIRTLVAVAAKERRPTTDR